MNMQQMLIQAQKMQREMQKAQDELAKKEFQVSKNGIVTITMLGNKVITSIQISESGMDKDDKEFLEMAIKDAINECIAQIEEANEAIQSKVTRGMGMPGF